MKLTDYVRIFREYVRIIWEYKWFVFLMIFITMGATLGFSLALPATYTATTTLKTGSGSSFYIPGYISPGKEMDLTTYEQLINTPDFKREVLILAKKKYAGLQAHYLTVDSFSLSVEAKGLSSTETRIPNLLLLSVRAPEPASAKALANAAAEALIRKTAELEFAAGKQLREVVTKKLQSTDKKLAQLRLEMERLKDQQADDPSVDRAINMGRLQDKINAAESLRLTYNNLLEQLSLGELIYGRPLQVIHSATRPTRPSGLSLATSLPVSLVVGFLLGVGASFVLNHKHKMEE